MCSSQLQFGFKKGLSTTQCTFSMLEVIDYYNVNKSSVCSLQLDASKAFDRVNYCKLFAELLKRNICPLLLRLLLFMYTRQSLRVKWGNTVSSEFTVSNGVKQGGVLSPILVCYIYRWIVETVRRDWCRMPYGQPLCWGSCLC